MLLLTLSCEALQPWFNKRGGKRRGRRRPKFWRKGEGELFFPPRGKKERVWHSGKAPFPLSHFLLQRGRALRCDEKKISRRRFFFDEKGMFWTRLHSVSRCERRWQHLRRRRCRQVIVVHDHRLVCRLHQVVSLVCCCSERKKLSNLFRKTGPPKNLFWINLFRQVWTWPRKTNRFSIKTFSRISGRINKERICIGQASSDTFAEFFRYRFRFRFRFWFLFREKFDQSNEHSAVFLSVRIFLTEISVFDKNCFVQIFPKTWNNYQNSTSCAKLQQRFVFTSFLNCLSLGGLSTTTLSFVCVYLAKTDTLIWNSV